MKDLALKAALVHHGRALHAIVKEEADSQQIEELRRLQEKARILLHSDNSSLAASASKWATVVILSQTPAPLLLHPRIPLELRGVTCLQDLEQKNFDPSGLQEQAEQLFEVLLQLLQAKGAAGAAPHLISAIASIARQRPAMFASAFHSFTKVLEGSDTSDEMQHLVAEEVHLWLASGLTSEWHPEIMQLKEKLRAKLTLEDLQTQSKIKQICRAADRDGDGPSARPKKRARKVECKYAWNSELSRKPRQRLYEDRDDDRILVVVESLRKEGR